MDPPDHRHMRSLLNKAFTPRAIQSQTRDGRSNSSSTTSAKADPDDFDVVQDFSGPFPVEVITRMLGVPEEFRQQVRHWIDTALQREPGQIELERRRACRPTSTPAMYYYDLIQERRDEPAGRHDQPADRRGDPARTADCASSTTSRSPASQRCWAARARRPSPSWSATPWCVFAQHPDQWQKLLDDRSKIPAAVEELLRYDGPVQYNVALQHERRRSCTAARSRRASRCS